MSPSKDDHGSSPEILQGDVPELEDEQPANAGVVLPEALRRADEQQRVREAAGHVVQRQGFDAQRGLGGCQVVAEECRPCAAGPQQPQLQQA